MFEFANKNFIHQSWIQNEKFRITICKNSNKRCFAAVFAEDKFRWVDSSISALKCWKTLTDKFCPDHKGNFANTRPISEMCQQMVSVWDQLFRDSSNNQNAMLNSNIISLEAQRLQSKWTKPLCSMFRWTVQLFMVRNKSWLAFFFVSQKAINDTLIFW